MTHEFVTNLVWLVPLPPLIAFALIVLFTNKNKALSHTVAISAAFLSWLGAMIIFWNAVTTEHFGEDPFTSSVNWLPTGDTWLKVGVLIDPLSAAVIVLRGVDSVDDLHLQRWLP